MQLQLKIAEEVKRGDKAEFDNKRNAEKLTFATTEKANLLSERESLKETLEVGFGVGRTGLIFRTYNGHPLSFHHARISS
jgi:hypothetical protein